MIRIATCGNIEVGERPVCEVLQTCAADAGITSVDVCDFASPLDLIEAVESPSVEGSVDLVILASSLQGMTGVQVAEELVGFEMSAPAVLIADSPAEAFKARQADVGLYFEKPVPVERFTSALTSCLQRIASLHEHSMVIKFRDSYRRVRFSEFMFAETSNHDQIVHVAGNRQYSLRATSQELFEQLPSDGTFFKAGSSSIINLRQIRTVRSAGGTITFSDGSTVSVPIRCRKPLEQAMFAIDAKRANAVRQRVE